MTKAAVNLKSDLRRLILDSLTTAGIKCDPTIELSQLATRYLDLCNRWITPTHRRVRISVEAKTTISNLDTRRAAVVNSIRQRFEYSRDVCRFLSKTTTQLIFNDGLLNDYGIHHLHLGNSHELDAHGFVPRDDQLLLVLVTDSTAYFVDVVPHPTRQGSGWVEQRLLEIIAANWPELLEQHVVRGTRGDRLTDDEKRELRRKRINIVTDLRGRAVAPLGGGTTAAGTNIIHTVHTDKLFAELEAYELNLQNHADEIRGTLNARGAEINGDIAFALTFLEDTDLAEREAEVIDSAIYRSGLAVVERSTHAPIVFDFGE